MAQPVVRTLAGQPYPATDPRDEFRARITELEQEVLALTAENQALRQENADYEIGLGIGDTD